MCPEWVLTGVPGPVEVRCAFDGGPAAEVGFEVDDVLDGANGCGHAEGEENG